MYQYKSNNYSNSKQSDLNSKNSTTNSYQSFYSNNNSLLQQSNNEYSKNMQRNDKEVKSGIQIVFNNNNYSNSTSKYTDFNPKSSYTNPYQSQSTYNSNCFSLLNKGYSKDFLRSDKELKQDTYFNNQQKQQESNTKYSYINSYQNQYSSNYYQQQQPVGQYSIELQRDDRDILIQLSQGNKYEKSLSNILTQFIDGIQRMGSRKKKVIFLMGNTGVGKTVLSAYLSGIKLVVKQNEYDEFYFDYQDSAQSKNRHIGQSLVESQTLFPNIFESNSDYLYIDCPGFSDSYGADYDILNSFFIHLFQKQAMIVKVLLVIDGSVLEQNGAGSEKAFGLKQLFEQLIYMTHKSMFNISKNLMIIMNKCQVEDYGSSFYQIKFQALVQQLSQSKDFINRINKYKSFENTQLFFKQIQSANIQLFPYPQEDQNSDYFANFGRQLLQQLESVKFYQYNDFNVPLNSNLYYQILLLVKHSKKLLEAKLVSICETLGNSIQNSSSQVSKFTNLLCKLERDLANNQNKDNHYYINQFKTQLVNPTLSTICFMSYSNSALKNQVEKDIKYIEMFSRVVFDLLFSKVDKEFSFAPIFQKLLHKRIKLVTVQFKKLEEQFKKQEAATKDLKVNQQYQQKQKAKLENKIYLLSKQNQNKQNEIEDLQYQIQKERNNKYYNYY